MATSQTDGRPFLQRGFRVKRSFPGHGVKGLMIPGTWVCLSRQSHHIQLNLFRPTSRVERLVLVVKANLCASLYSHLYTVRAQVHQKKKSSGMVRTFSPQAFRLLNQILRNPHPFYHALSHPTPPYTTRQELPWSHICTRCRHLLVCHFPHDSKMDQLHITECVNQC